MDPYPEWTKQQWMLLWFWNALQDAYNKGDSDLRVEIVWGGDEAGVYVYVPVTESDSVDPNIHSRRVNVSNAIPELSRGAEAVAVFDRLRMEEYVRASLGPGSLGTFYDLSSKGRIDIGKFPDPDSSQILTRGSLRPLRRCAGASSKACLLPTPGEILGYRR